MPKKKKSLPPREVKRILCESIDGVLPQPPLPSEEVPEEAAKRLLERIEMMTGIDLKN